MPSLARCIALSLLFAADGAHAAPWTYRGMLNDGDTPANGRYEIRLSVLDAAGAKALVFPLTFSGVEVKDGAFAVDVDFGIDLGQLGAVLLKTEVAQGASGFVELGEPRLFDPKALSAGVCWDTQGNAGTNPATDFIGTTDAQPLVLRAENLVGARLQRNGLGINWTAGYDVQAASGSSAITIGGGSGQRAWTNGSTIAGGINNVAGDSSLFPSFGISATVGGGIANLARGQYATVGGGSANRAIGQSATVSGGELNRAIGTAATVSGGAEACAGGRFSWASGLRVAARPGTSGDLCSFTSVTSGDADGDEGTFVWGDASGEAFVSTGPNQFLVRSEGGVGINGTPATAGLELNVFGATPFDGFVEFGLIPKPSLNGNTGERVEIGVGKGGAGSNDADLRIAHRNDSGGFFEHVSIDGDGSVIVRSNPANTAQGVQLAIGAGAWSSLSDRNLKTDIQSIEPLQLLERLVAMPIQQWRYIGQPGEVLHIGPMAQDFAAAFGVGENDTTISTVDADGVALAAIQGLNQKLEGENASLRAQLQQLAARLAALEAAGEH